VYGSIESGFPVIVCFRINDPEQVDGEHELTGHAIPIFGHTFNEDSWVPAAEQFYFEVGPNTTFIPSESWVSMYIGHDDNWGSNFCIPRNFLYTKPYCTMLKEGPELCKMRPECVAHVIATVPKEIKVEPLEAQAIGAGYLLPILSQAAKDPSYGTAWDARLQSYARVNRLVLRPLLIDGLEYSQHLAKVRDWDYNRIDEATINVVKNALSRTLSPGEKVWMIELSVPELFSANRRKVAEVIIKAELEVADEQAYDSFVLARLPSSLVLLPEEPSGLEPEFDFYDTGISGHAELFACEDEA
jgi:hypothetical protein